MAHGTRSAMGQEQIRDLTAAVALRRLDLDVRLCYVDVQQPRLSTVIPALEPAATRPARNGADYRAREVMDRAARDAVDRPVRGAVVVPLLLSAGYHVRVDIAEAVAGTGIAVAGPLGPDDALRDAMIRHLPGDADAVVLAAAGSSDPAWRASITQEAAVLGAHVAYASGSGPGVADVVARLRDGGARRIAVAAYLLADGLFYRSLHRAGADSVTLPLCRDPAMTALILRRYESAILTTAAAPL